MTPVMLGVRASLDAGGRKGESMDMENRIAVLERDVNAIKSELAVIRRDHVDSTELNARGQRQLTTDVAQLKDEMASVRIELTRLSALQENCATKADMKALEANIKGWMLVITLSLMTSVFAIVYPLYGLLKPTVAVKPVAVKATQAQHIVAPVAPAHADSKVMTYLRPGW
jgi:hypothetical protein